MIDKYLKLIDRIKDLLKYLFTPFQSPLEKIDSIVSRIFRPFKPLSEMIDGIIKWFYK